MNHFIAIFYHCMSTKVALCLFALWINETGSGWLGGEANQKANSVETSFAFQLATIPYSRDNRNNHEQTSCKIFVNFVCWLNQSNLNTGCTLNTENKKKGKKSYVRPTINKRSRKALLPPPSLSNLLEPIKPI